MADKVPPPSYFASISPPQPRRRGVFTKPPRRDGSRSLDAGYAERLRFAPPMSFDFVMPMRPIAVRRLSLPFERIEPRFTLPPPGFAFVTADEFLGLRRQASRAFAFDGGCHATPCSYQMPPATISCLPKEASVVLSLHPPPAHMITSLPPPDVHVYIFFFFATQSLLLIAARPASASRHFALAAITSRRRRDAVRYHAASRCTPPPRYLRRQADGAPFSAPMSRFHHARLNTNVAFFCATAIIASAADTAASCWPLSMLRRVIFSADASNAAGRR